MFIMLDIDGVMVSAKSWSSPELLPDGFVQFSSKASRALQRIITETGATILLTTSHKSKYTINQWYKMFKTRGLEVDKIERLPESSYYVSRKDEILNWYNNNNKNDNFVIIDDDKTLNGLSTFLKEKLILTSSLIGLTDELASKAIAVLKNKESITLG